MYFYVLREPHVIQMSDANTSMFKVMVCFYIEILLFLQGHDKEGGVGSGSSRCYAERSQ